MSVFSDHKTGFVRPGHICHPVAHPPFSSYTERCRKEVSFIAKIFIVTEFCSVVPDVYLS